MDRAVRERIQAKLIELGEKDPKKAFKTEENHPWIGTEDAKRPIHKVRIRMNLETFPVGSGHGTRHVQSDSNHHMEIFEVTDKKGIKKWEGHVVSMYEAHLRLRKKEPIIKKDRGDGKKFIFSLAKGEMIELNGNDDKRILYEVRKMSSGNKQIFFNHISDARMYSKISKSGLSAFPDGLRKLNCKKVVITPLGEIRNAND